MRIQTIFRGLLLALIALASFLPPAAFAGWADATEFLKVIATRQALDRSSGKTIAYITLQNTKLGSTVTGPFRVAIPTSNKAVTNKDGDTADGKPYVNIAEASLVPNQQVTVRVEFAQQRGALTYTTRAEWYNAMTAQIGLGPTAVEGTQMTMTGIANDPDGTVSYAWTQTAGPSVGVTGSTAQSLTFTAPSGLTAPVTLTFQLTATDQFPTTATATASIVIQPDNIYVSAGKDRTAYPGNVVSLHGYSYGSGPSPSFSWSQIGGTPIMALSNPNSPNPTFTVPAVTDPFAGPPPTFSFRLTFTDGIKTATSDVNVKISDPNPALANSPLGLNNAQPKAPLVVVAPPPAAVAYGTTQKLIALANGGDGNYKWFWKDNTSTTDSDCKITPTGPFGPVLTVTFPTYSAGNNSDCNDASTAYKFAVTVADAGYDPAGAGSIPIEHFFTDDTTWFASPGATVNPLDVYAPSLSASEGPQPVTIGASASGGAPGYTYSWTQTGGPTVPLQNANTANPSFQLPAVDGHHADFPGHRHRQRQRLGGQGHERPGAQHLRHRPAPGSAPAAAGAGHGGIG